ncbi:flagellar motor protein [Candidatus Tenderia electrophaga]|jgi:chemotaxis protein MotA|uniref:Flagellar motor protein n=1 Tax=Candidatus Tenderia electrophaga TaxID=1748243 RepID=A0A0S2TC82_9GAMM|nr:flagellar motor protein [Candidatus Tenderia electrophaga]
MDILTLIGLALGFGAILVGNILEGGHTDSLVQGVAFLIVAGGTVGAVMVQTPLSVFLRSLKMFMWIFLPPKVEQKAAVEKIVSWSNIARKEGLLGLESLVESETDSFAQKGLQLLVDGSEPETIRSILEVEIGVKEHFDTQAAKVYEGLGGYSPTIGIIGAVMGLIHVMNNLADPSKLGSGIAVAFVATIYGVGLANLIFLPVATKLKGIIHNQTQFREMVVEGVISIAEGENPRNIETKLDGYLH